MDLDYGQKVKREGPGNKWETETYVFLSKVNEQTSLKVSEIIKSGKGLQNM